MARGKPRKWVTAHINRPIELGKSGIKVVVWKKWGKTRRGTVVITVGGIRWYPYKAKRPYGLNWDEFDQLMTGT